MAGLFAGSALVGQTVPGATWDDTARLLAGLPGRPASPFKSLEGLPAWKDHAARFDQAWGALERERFNEMHRFESHELSAPALVERTLLYPFGGPDVLNVLTLFPHNRTYVLIGLEPVGTLPGEAGIRTHLDTLLAATRDSLDSLLHRSFFITREMDRSLRGQLFDGLLPALLVQLARMNCEVAAVTTVHVAEGGVVAPWDREKVSAKSLRNRGVDITFRRAGEPSPQHLYFFTVDLGPKLARNAAFNGFLDRGAPFTTFLKATSYMTHHPGFRFLCSKLLAVSQTILQDDSGLPFRNFEPTKWDVQLYGSYEKPYGSFHYLAQEDLHRAYEAPGAAKPLEFRIGYGYSKVPSNLLLARRRTSPVTGAGR